MNKSEMLNKKNKRMELAAVSIVSIYDNARWVDKKEADKMLIEAIRFIKSRKK